MLNPFHPSPTHEMPRNVRRVATALAVAALTAWFYFLVSGGVELNDPSAERERCRAAGGAWTEGYYGGRVAGICAYPPRH